MENYKNFSTYQPENAPVEVLVLPDGRPAVMTWLRDEVGNDWYDVQQHFSGDTIKLLYDGDNVIRCCSMDVTELNPINMSAAEVAVADIPEDAADALTDGSWCFVDGQIQQRIYTPDEIREKAQEIKAELLREAESIIAPLERAVKYGMASEEDVASLEAWERYSVKLMRAKPEDASGIEIPVKPE